jgi:hypothetical protein
MTPRFEPTREDGRSDVDVVVGLMAEADPGTIFPYGDLIAALSDGTDREIDVPVVGRAVRGARGKMLELYQRRATCLPGVGYRIASASEHKAIAVDHRRKSERQMRWAVRTLSHVRWEEMDPNARMAHEAQLTIMAGIYQTVQAMRKTQDRHERVLRDLVAGKAAQPENVAA